MNLKTLVQRELTEGLSAEELADSAGVSVQTVTKILADELPNDPSDWESFVRYFRLDQETLQSGTSISPAGFFNLITGGHPSTAGSVRKIPLLGWDQVTQVSSCQDPAQFVKVATFIEADLSGARTFAVPVRDDSMYPLFRPKEIICVNPDEPAESSHYALIVNQDVQADEWFVRQLRVSENQLLLHPLNRKYADCLLANHHRILGRVVRLHKNL